jgi:hypothetical protein
VQDVVQQGLPILRRERGTQREQFIQRDSQRIDVGPIVQQFSISTVGLLGAHVAERAQHVSR